ncbi:hypothetical protein [Bradyrhizobium tunisiense]|uniref:IS66 family transposase n=1 Tax=Bradyrhizobium tunisiense TaxID=3278709 RepID=UPI003D9BFEF7
MTSKPDDLPSDLVSALAALQAEREARLQAEAVAASARAELSANEALIVHLELRIEKLKRELYGQRSERTARLIEQLELELEDSSPRRARTSLPRGLPRRKPRACAPSRASDHYASPGRTTSNASASSLRRPRPAPVAVGRAWRSWARM